VAQFGGAARRALAGGGDGVQDRARARVTAHAFGLAAVCRAAATSHAPRPGAWALDEIGFFGLHLDHSTRNNASCRVATESGYLLEGTKRSAGLHDDGRHDRHLHARVRDV
jgi:hypothetical protein